MVVCGHPFCDGGAWLRSRVRVRRVVVGQSWLWRGCSWGAVAGAVEFGAPDLGERAGSGCLGIG